MPTEKKRLQKEDTNSEDIKVCIKKVELLEQKGKYEEALKYFEKINLEETENLDLYLYKGRLYGKCGYIEKAIWQFDKALEISPKFSDAYLEKADLYFDIGESDKGMQCYKAWEALEIEKEDK